MTGRTAAVRAVGRVMRAGAYSNRVIAAEARDLGPKDTATAHRIGYGVIRWLLRIDHAIETHSSRPMHNVQPVVWDVLRAATWEVVFGNIPNAIAVDSAVETVREMGHPRAAGFVNAVLRSLTRSGEPVLEDRALAASVPQPVLDLLDQRFGPEEADRFLAASNRDAPLQARSRPSGHQVGAEGGAQLKFEMPGRFPRFQMVGLSRIPRRWQSDGPSLRNLDLGRWTWPQHQVARRCTSSTRERTSLPWTGMHGACSARSAA